MSEKVLCDCCCEREATARDSIVGANYSADCLNNYGTQRIMDRIQARRGLTECAACGAMHDRANGPTWTHSMDGVIYLTCGNCPLDGTSQRIRARLSAKRPSPSDAVDALAYAQAAKPNLTCCSCSAPATIGARCTYCSCLL